MWQLVGKRVVCVESSESRAPKEDQDSLPSGGVKIRAASYSEEKSRSESLVVLYGGGLKRTTSPNSNQLVSLSNFARTGGQDLDLCQVLQSLTVGLMLMLLTIVLAIVRSLIP